MPDSEAAIAKSCRAKSRMVQSSGDNLLSPTHRKDKTMLGKSLIAGLAAAVVLIVVCVEGGKHMIGTEKGHGADVLLEAKSEPHDLHFSNVCYQLSCIFRTV
jgi:hypothetical protein